MRSREGLFILFILAVLCSTGFSLQCYSCLDPVSYCNSSTTCSVNLDTCAIVVSGPRIYHQCWKFSGCNFAFFAERLGESKLQYRCCQSDLCNRELKEKEEKEKEKDGTVILSGKTMLLVTLVLTTAWNYSL